MWQARKMSASFKDAEAAASAAAAAAAAKPMLARADTDPGGSVAKTRKERRRASWSDDVLQVPDAAPARKMSVPKSEKFGAAARKLSAHEHGSLKSLLAAGAAGDGGVAPRPAAGTTAEEAALGAEVAAMAGALAATATEGASYRAELEASPKPAKTDAKGRTRKERRRASWSDDVLQVPAAAPPTPKSEKFEAASRRHSALEHGAMKGLQAAGAAEAPTLQLPPEATPARAGAAAAGMVVEGVAAGKAARVEPAAAPPVREEAAAAAEEAAAAGGPPASPPLSVEEHSELRRMYAEALEVGTGGSTSASDERHGRHEGTSMAATLAAQGIKLATGTPHRGPPRPKTAPAKAYGAAGGGIKKPDPPTAAEPAAPTEGAAAGVAAREVTHQAAQEQWRRGDDRARGQDKEAHRAQVYAANSIFREHSGVTRDQAEAGSASAGAQGPVGGGGCWDAPPAEPAVSSDCASHAPGPDASAASCL
jgi:hypothetical protein